MNHHTEKLLSREKKCSVITLIPYGGGYQIKNVFVSRSKYNVIGSVPLCKFNLYVENKWDPKYPHNRAGARGRY